MKDNDNISDQLVAAFLDGNTDRAETIRVMDALAHDAELREVMDIATSLDDDIMEAGDELPMMKLAAESGDNVCSVVCEAYVLRRRGIAFGEGELLATARHNRWLSPKGTPLHAIGLLLAQWGLMVTRKYDATLDDIRNALAVDNDVLVVVDSDKLHPGQPDSEDEPNHAVVATAVDDKTITLFDPQQLSTFVVPHSTFNNAWRESQCYMVRVLQTVDDYRPQPIGLDDIQLTDELLELREAIAENAHEVWAAARSREGWTYGTQRDDAHKRHPDLVPYSALSDSEKEYDRRMAFDTIKLLQKLGYDLVKRNGNPK